MSQSSLEAFKKAKDDLLSDYKDKCSEVAALRRELIALGALREDEPKAKKKKRKRVVSEETRKKMKAAWAKRKANKS